jgi:hypothetical protein
VNVAEGVCVFRLMEPFGGAPLSSQAAAARNTRLVAASVRMGLRFIDALSINTTDGVASRFHHTGPRGLYVFAQRYFVTGIATTGIR